MDKLSADRRSANMRAIQSRDTIPELQVRRMAHAMGYKFRLHQSNLPGKPDLVFSQRHKLIFVHGCFWHQHRKCKDGRLPQSNKAYWNQKLAGNVKRDKLHLVKLKTDGWKVLVVWECETENERQLLSRLQYFLRST